MKITDLINEERIMIDVAFENKSDVIVKLSQKYHDLGIVSDAQGFKEAIEHRESQGSTGIGMGIAIPHAKSEHVKKPALLFARAQGDGVDYEAMDESLSDLIFMIAVPSGGENLHLKILQKLSRKLMHDEFRESLREATDVKSIMKILEEMDKED